MCHGLDATLTEIEHAVNEAVFPTAADKDEAIISDEVSQTCYSRMETSHPKIT